MGQIDEAIREHEKTCEERLPHRYVHWSWMVGILLSVAMAIGGSAWALSDRLSNVNAECVVNSEVNRSQARDIEMMRVQLSTQLAEINDNTRWIRDQLKRR